MMLTYQVHPKPCPGLEQKLQERKVTTNQSTGEGMNKQYGWAKTKRQDEQNKYDCPPGEEKVYISPNTLFLRGQSLSSFMAGTSSLHSKAASHSVSYCKNEYSRPIFFPATAAIKIFTSCSNGNS